MKANHMNLGIRSYSSEMHAHQHDFHQLVFSISGLLEMNVNGIEGRISQHHAAIVSAGKDHGFAAHGNNRFLVADVPDTLAPELARFPTFVAIDETLLQFVNFMSLTLSESNGSNRSERQMLILLIQLISERFGYEVNIDKRIEAARSYLDRYYFQAISLSRLASVANLSVRQLTTLFRRQLGTTPQQYLTEKRMQIAWQSLMSTSQTIQQIAESVGYQSLSAFSDRFRKHFGRSPRHFRQIDK